MRSSTLLASKLLAALGIHPGPVFVSWRVVSNGTPRSAEFRLPWAAETHARRQFDLGFSATVLRVERDARGIERGTSVAASYLRPMTEAAHVH